PSPHPVRTLRSGMIIPCLLLSLLGVTATQGWSIHIQPSGERLLNRVADENFLVVCSVKEYDGIASNVQVNWIRDNEVIRAGGRIMTIEKPLSSQLMIVRARKEDSGDYMCQVKLNGTIKVEPAKITFIKAPKFVEPKTDQHPEDGSDGEIECRVDAEPGVEMIWQFNGDTLGESSTRAYEFKDNKQILVIPRFDSKKDDGLYLCNAAQFSSFETLHINVTAYSRPSITIFESPKEDLGFEGQSAQFKCAATGKPAPTYKWFKVAEDEEITASDLYTVEDGLLVVNTLAASNSGQYKCVATNEIGEDDKTAKLNVFLKPVVQKIPNARKEDGEEVTFTCEFKGEGKVNAKFIFGEEEYKLGGEDEEEKEEDGDEDRKEEETTNDANDDEEEEEGTDEEKKENEEDGNGEEEHDGDEHHHEEDEETTTAEDVDDEADNTSDVSDEMAKEMHDATPNDEDGDHLEGGHHGNHEARIEHVDAILAPATEMEDEEVISTTEASNEIEEEDKDENEVATTEINEDGDNDEDETTTGDAKDEDEDEEKKWKRFVRDITSERVSVKEEEGVLTLTIRRLTASDAGDYQCVVENEAGRTVRSTSLAITHAPEITKFEREPVRASDGDDFTLRCAASAVPDPIWSWKRNGVELDADGTRVTIDFDASSSSLSIKEAIKEDFGSIECTASNGVGEPATVTMTVVRVVAPSTPSAPNCREHLFPNYGQCTFNPDDFESDEGDATPEKIVFFVATTDEAKEEGFDFQTQARNFTVNYNGAKMRLHSLNVNKGYAVRAMAVNEAGESELSPQATMETTDPWTPEAPYEVDVKCDTSCEVSWKEPNNHGAPITSYKIELVEIEADENNDFVQLDKVEYDVEEDDDSFVIPSMKPNTRYEISVIAANDVGQSAATQIVVDTPETVSSSPLTLENLSSTKSIAILVVILFLVVFVIDAVCSFCFGCGVLACCLRRCRADSHKKNAGTDLESGKTAESGRLLDGPAR
ncbi:hypothetical protein PENTCL1PPCAC_27878, partial [Pristionchus entomophagus]